MEAKMSTLRCRGRDEKDENFKVEIERMRPQG